MGSTLSALVALLWSFSSTIVNVGPCEIVGGLRLWSPYVTTQRPGTVVHYVCSDWGWAYEGSLLPSDNKTRSRVATSGDVLIARIYIPENPSERDFYTMYSPPDFPAANPGSWTGGTLYANALYPWIDSGTYNGQACCDLAFTQFQATGYSSVSVRVTPSNACELVSNASCNQCAWPYASDLSPNDCACRINYKRLQPVENLLAQCKLYCQTAGDDGTQYYYDASRTRINDKIAECACSSPMAGKTVYMPAQKCPEGSSAVGYDLSDNDTGLVFEPDVPDNRTGSGGGSDTGIYKTRLDTIIDRLYAINSYTLMAGNTLDSILRLLEGGVGGGSGEDTGTHRRLDDILSYMDTSGNFYYDSVNNRLGYVIDSISNDTFDIRPSIDSLMGIINAHSSRGDTASYNGATLDSMLNFCITIPIHDSTYCLRDTAAWPYIGPWFRWIRRMILVFWGFVCAGIFLAIAHGGRDD